MKVHVKPIRLTGIVKGEELRPGMIVSKDDNPRHAEILAPLTGACNHGLHFGSGCYDRISTWFRFERR